jgi:hypothetical protein
MGVVAITRTPRRRWAEEGLRALAGRWLLEI